MEIRGVVAIVPGLGKVNVTLVLTESQVLSAVRDAYLIVQEEERRAEIRRKRGELYKADDFPGKGDLPHDRLSNWYAERGIERRVANALARAYIYPRQLFDITEEDLVYTRNIGQKSIPIIMSFVERMKLDGPNM